MMGFIRAVLFYLGIFSGMIILGTPYIIYKGAICRRKNEITNVCTFYFKNVIFKLFGLKIKVEGVLHVVKMVLLKSYAENSVIFHGHSFEIKLYKGM